MNTRTDKELMADIKVVNERVELLEDLRHINNMAATKNSTTAIEKATRTLYEKYKARWEAEYAA
jgi:hypothetical protein